MTNIKSVAARVGRRYYGGRESGDLESILAAAGMGTSSGTNKAPGELQFFEGSPSPEADEAEAETAAADPYATAVDPYGGVTEVQDDEEYEESEEEGHEPDEIVELDPEGSVGLEPEAKRRRIGNDLETSGIVELDVDEDAAALGVKECVAEEAEDADEGEDDNLFF